MIYVFAAAALLVQHTVADMNGSGHVVVRTGGSFQGCLDATMKWVVDGNCGVFTAKTLKGSSTSRWFPWLLSLLPLAVDKDGQNSR